MGLPKFLALLLSMIRALNLLCFLFAASAAFCQSSGSDAYDAFWMEEEIEFADPEKSPLEKADIASFTEIYRFSYDSTFTVDARYEEVKRQKPFKMAATCARRPTKKWVCCILSFRKTRWS